jgi:hypothetical protein
MADSESPKVGCLFSAQYSLRDYGTMYEENSGNFEGGRQVLGSRSAQERGGGVLRDSGEGESTTSLFSGGSGIALPEPFDALFVINLDAFEIGVGNSELEDPARLIAGDLEGESALFSGGCLLSVPSWFESSMLRFVLPFLRPFRCHL